MHLNSNVDLDQSLGDVVDLGAEPCQLSREELKERLYKVWATVSPGTVVIMQIPHPNHPRAKQYTNPIWPEDLHELLQLNKLGYSDAEVGLELSSEWQELLDSGKKTPDEMAIEAQRTAGVVEWIHIELKVARASAGADIRSLVTGDMRAQLMEQWRSQLDRGDVEAAATIQRLIAELDNG